MKITEDPCKEISQHINQTKQQFSNLMKLLSKLPSHLPPCTAHLFWQNWEIKFLCSAHVTPGTIKETHGTWRYGIKSGLGKGNSQNSHVA